MTKDQLFSLPDAHQGEFLRQLVDFGHLLENKTRAGCEFDLNVWPNSLWQTIEANMLSGLELFKSARPAVGEVLMLQWYNSGVFIKTTGRTLAFDVTALPRYYGWPDVHGLTQKIAGCVDAMFVTHNHQDHFDVELAKACLLLNKPVFMHSDATVGCSGISGMVDGAKVAIDNFIVRAHHCCHVWRHEAAEVPLTSFEVCCGDNFRFLFCGDADYTKGFAKVRPGLDALFITWRNPGPKFEDGHPEQIGTTADAVRIVLEELKPRRLILQHYGELDHIYKGFPASYEIAVGLIETLPLPTSIYFWGDLARLD